MCVWSFFHSSPCLSQWPPCIRQDCQRPQKYTLPVALGANLSWAISIKLIEQIVGRYSTRNPLSQCELFYSVRLIWAVQYQRHSGRLMCFGDKYQLALGAWRMQGELPTLTVPISSTSLNSKGWPCPQGHFGPRIQRLREHVQLPTDTYIRCGAIITFTLPEVQREGRWKYNSHCTM